MNKKIIIIFVAIITAGITLSVLANGKNSTREQSQKSASAENPSREEKQSADKVEVFLFHSTNRCISCVTIGKYAGETVYEYFQGELRDGKMEFREINIDLPENKELAWKFQASGSSLFINAIFNGKDNITEDTRVWRLISSESQFKNYLKDKLNNFLGK